MKHPMPSKSKTDRTSPAAAGRLRRIVRQFEFFTGMPRTEGFYLVELSPDVRSITGSHYKDKRYVFQIAECRRAYATDAHRAGNPDLMRWVEWHPENVLLWAKLPNDQARAPEGLPAATGSLSEQQTTES